MERSDRSWRSRCFFVFRGMARIRRTGQIFKEKKEQTNSDDSSSLAPGFGGKEGKKPRGVRQGPEEGGEGRGRGDRERGGGGPLRRHASDRALDASDRSDIGGLLSFFGGVIFFAGFSHRLPGLPAFLS